MNLRWWRRITVACSLALAKPQVTLAQPSFRPDGFGFNLSQSLINPLEHGSSETALRQEVAGILYDARMVGGEVIRWIVTDVWPQWRCSLDPEDQRTGQIDPAWYIVSRVLLEEAARQGVSVVVSLSYLSNGGFAASSTDPVQVTATAQRMAAYRQEMVGLDGYGHHALSACPGVAGYYGHTNQAAFFSDNGLRTHLRQRNVEMARYLADFPALGAIELFNEPDMALTVTPEYWDTVRDLRRAIQGASAQASRIPIFSGTAAWSRAIVDAAQKGGALTEEPFITVHAYDDYSVAGKDVGASLHALLTYLRSLVPDKAVVIAEIGGSTPIRTLAQYRPMLDAIMGVYLNSQSGVWVWGNWFPQPETSDFAMDFNHRSAIGPAFRPYFFADRETEYAEPRFVHGIDASTGATSSMALIINRIPETDANPFLRGLWVITIGEMRLIGFSRAGVFSRPYQDAPSRFAEPPPTLFLSAHGESLRWAAMVHTSPDWEMRLFDCVLDQGAAKPGDIATPDELLGLATDQHRDDVAGCVQSRLRLRLKI